jgi:hypothetical protein
MMTRDEAAIEIGLRLALLLEEADITASDDPGALKEPIDDALRLMGYAEAEIATADPDDVPGFLTTLRYFTLRAIRDALAVNFDITSDGDSFRLSQVRDAVEKMLTAAAADVVAIYGRLTITSADAAIISVDLNFKDRNTLTESFA